MMVFTVPITIRFQHCDPAGIVFYPRYFEMFNLVVEEWFEQVIGVSFNQLHTEQDIGVPTVRIETEFRAVSYLEDVVSFGLAVTRVGRSSVNFKIQGRCGEEIRCTTDLTIVCVDMNSRKARSWPAFIRSKVETFCKEAQ